MSIATYTVDSSAHMIPKLINVNNRHITIQYLFYQMQYNYFVHCIVKLAVKHQEVLGVPHHQVDQQVL